jgi:hypothetical protein
MFSSETRTKTTLKVTALYKTLILDEEREELVFLEENVLVVHCLRKTLVRQSYSLKSAFC